MPDASNLGFGGRPIQNSDDCLAAEERIAKLSVAPEGSDEEAERVGLIDAVNAYRLRHGGPQSEGLAKAITSVDQYKQAAQRVAELADSPEGTPQAEELHRLVADIRSWAEQHDDAMR